MTFSVWDAIEAKGESKQIDDMQMDKIEDMMYDDEGKFIPMELGMLEDHLEDVTRLKTSEYAPTLNTASLSAM